MVHTDVKFSAYHATLTEHWCGSCQKKKDVSEFYVQKRKTQFNDGLHDPYYLAYSCYCKVCHNKFSRENAKGYCEVCKKEVGNIRAHAKTKIHQAKLAEAEL